MASQYIRRILQNRGKAVLCVQQSYLIVLMELVPALAAIVTL